MNSDSGFRHGVRVGRSAMHGTSIDPETGESKQESELFFHEISPESTRKPQCSTYMLRFVCIFCVSAIVFFSLALIVIKKMGIYDQLFSDTNKELPLPNVILLNSSDELNSSSISMN